MNCPFWTCGRPSVEGSDYCVQHKAAMQTATVREKQAALRRLIEEAGWKVIQAAKAWRSADTLANYAAVTGAVDALLALEKQGEMT